MDTKTDHIEMNEWREPEHLEEVLVIKVLQ